MPEVQKAPGPVPTSPIGNSGQYVTVACKLPHGLDMRVFTMVDTYEPVIGGGNRKVSIAQELPERHRLNGFSHPQNQGPRHQIIGGYALTRRIPKEFWEKWLEQNKTSMLVRNGLVFAHDKAEFVEGKAEEQAEIKSGLERLDPNNLPKDIKGIKPFGRTESLAA